MTYAWIGAAALVIGELIGGTFAFLWPRRRQAKGENLFVAGKVTDFKVARSSRFVRKRPSS